MPIPTVGYFVQLPDFLLDSKEYITLSYAAKIVLTYLLKSYRKEGNGDLCLTALQAQKYEIDKKTQTKALRDLRKAGIIMQTAKHNNRNPDRYAVFWKEWEVSPNSKSDKYKDLFFEWQKQQLQLFSKYATGTVPIFKEINKH